MNHLIRVVLSAALFFAVLLYLGCSFVFANFDPASWGFDTRLNMLLLWVLLTMLTVAVLEGLL